MRERIKKLTPHFFIAIYRAARCYGITVLFFLIRLFSIKKNLVVLCNVWGYGDNAKYVAEELIRRKRKAVGKREKEVGKASIELVFVTNHPKQVPICPEIRAVRTNSLPAILALGRARVWVDNNRKEAYIRKRKGQYYIQLWHGGIALKRIEGDCAEELGKAYIQRARKDSKETDLFVSNSTFCTKMYQRAFWAKCEIAEYGSPRNDAFLHPASSNSSVPFTPSQQAQKEHIAVYAPTYRNGNAKYYDFDTEKLRKALYRRFGGNWTILVRLHPLVAESHQFAGLAGVVDISFAPDLYEVLYTADLLITDYSNTMFEFAMTKRPVFLYANDVKAYQAERGLYFPYHTLPFPKAGTPEAFYKIIEGYQEEEYQKAQEEFFRNVGLKESGKAAGLVADRIEKVLGCNRKNNGTFL